MNELIICCGIIIILLSILYKVYYLCIYYRLNHIDTPRNIDNNNETTDIVVNNDNLSIPNTIVNIYTGYYRELEPYQNIYDSLECSICLESYKFSSIIKILPCGHLYHSKCIEDWLKISNVCPFCFSFSR